MSVFSEIERSIERGFRHWTERVFGPADSDQLLLTYRAVLEEVEGKVQIVARGRRVFPYSHLVVTFTAPDADRRAVCQTAFGEGGRLESDIREALEGAGCEIPQGFGVEVRTADAGSRPFEIEYGMAPREAESAPQENPEPKPEPAAKPQPASHARLVVVRGKAQSAEYELAKARTNIGRMAELMDSDQRVLRRNDIVFEDGADEANGTVSRSHAHIVRGEAGEYRLCDDESQYGVRIFRDGRSIDVPSGNRRGERLRPGDEIYLGRACLRFEA